MNVFLNTKKSKLLYLKQVMEWVPYKRTTIWKMCRAGTFPAPVKIGGNRIAFYEDEIINWIESFRQQNIEPKLPVGRSYKFDKEVVK